MWMEVKAVFTVIGIVFIGIVISQILLYEMILGLLLILGIGVYVVGDFMIGLKIVDFKPLYDPTPMGYELMELQLLDGKVRYMNTKKGPYGKRSFRINNEDASVINDGRGGFILSNGNRGFRAHENFDMNIEPSRAKALESMPGKDVKEMYYQARQEMAKKIMEGT